MNIKTLAAVVGALSLGSLATGCATSKSADMGAGASTETASTPDKAGEAAPHSASPATAKEGQMTCGANGCQSAKPAPTKEGQMTCGSNGCQSAKPQ